MNCVWYNFGCVSTKAMVAWSDQLRIDAANADRDEAERMDAELNAYRANRAANVSDARLAYWRAQDAVVNARAHLEKLLAS